MTFRRAQKLIEEHKRSGDRNQRADDSVGFPHAITTISRPNAYGCLHAFGCWRQHGRVLALAFVALRTGNLLERSPLARSGAEPHIRRSLARRLRTEKIGRPGG